jgi:hypothetical protein
MAIFEGYDMPDTGQNSKLRGWRKVLLKEVVLMKAILMDATVPKRSPVRNDG